MNRKPKLRAIGFEPSEISAMVNEAVVSRHAEEASFLWTLRDRAVGEPHYGLRELIALDERVEAHVDGLRVAGGIGWEQARKNLETGEAGEVFAAGVLAFAHGDRERMLEALNVASASLTAARGLVSALAWLDYPAVSRWIDRLVTAKSAVHRAIGIAAAAAHRQAPGESLTSAADDADAQLRWRALRAAGQLKRFDLLPALHRHLNDADEGCRFWAAWSMTLMGERAGLRVLAEWFTRKDALALRALQVSLRAMPLEQSRQWISTMAKESELQRQAIVGAGIVGDPASIPWLIRRMQEQGLERVAGESFSMITGIDLSFHDLDQDAPAGTVEAGRESAVEEGSVEEVMELDNDANLPWPAPNRVSRWWVDHGSTFSPGLRYLAGQSMTTQSLAEVLKTGKQRQRASAALELSLLHRERPLFEVRARGDRQQRDLDAWNS